ncbi:hypothetical protein EON65_47290 [archaeon]|nr:MAG: hypothetical protein EON65_47290 [archaeon]
MSAVGLSKASHWMLRALPAIIALTSYSAVVQEGGLTFGSYEDWFIVLNVLNTIDVVRRNYM